MGVLANPGRGVALIVALLLAAILLPVDVISQDANRQPTQEEIMQMMGPMMGQMMEVMMDAMLTTMAKPQSAEKLATFTRNYYEALIAKGFAKEEALKIVTSMGIPTVPAMK